MIIELIHHTPLSVADTAISKCYETGCKVNYDEMVKRMDTIANISKHASTIEHLTYNFNIMGVSRALLQELARHRIASYSVKSSRYTLKELKKEIPFVKAFSYIPTTDSYKGILRSKGKERASKYIVWTGDTDIDFSNVVKLDMLRIAVQNGKKNDLSKYSMPECYKTNLVWSINARALQNFLTLRTSDKALWEIQLMARKVFDKIPDDHKFLFVNSLFKKKELEFIITKPS